MWNLQQKKINWEISNIDSFDYVNKKGNFKDLV